ncbi:hypothetical protein LCGC14_3019220 [marine sediment metagenome]|uniref:DnaA N-terminal domain-containing protein n=1 Tax=marine sediment metagenome TaxID=412755 RepID=A0A0F8ZLZ3_9ZZZZ
MGMKRRSVTMTNESWGAVRQGLRKSVGQNNYTTWIEPLEFSDLTDGIATFVVPSQFVGNWVSRNFGEQIIQEITATCMVARRLSRNLSRRRPAYRTFPESCQYGGVGA